jgi:hypothetical protein
MIRQLVSPLADQTIVMVAQAVAESIDDRISQVASSDEFMQANSLGASSSQVQALLTPTLENLGFESELRSKAVSAEFRPDFTKFVGGSAILAEIERGKTLDNNMDMLDMWKTHVHPVANHLILIVPVWYETSKFKRSTFMSVCRRMEPFFAPGNYSNVHSLHIVGY